MQDTAVKIIGDLLTLLSIPFTEIQTKKDGDMLRINVVTPETSRLIGWHGETLNAVQHLVKSVIRTQQKMEKAPFIVMDTDGYRTEQEQKVCRIAEAKADFVRRTGARVALPPMSPYFRRVVHTFVASTPSMSDLTTESVGEGDYRQIVIRSKAEKSVESGEELSPVMATDDGLENLDV
ncbi:MAG: R3H domain-containing nucleic acid-binding protein [Candidatus Peribacteraceae bacterium]